MAALEHAALLERARNIRLLALDVDGVLTDGRLYFDQNGNEMKAFSTRDGLGVKALQHFDIKVALITARESRMVTDRAAQLGIELVYQGRENKRNALAELMSETGMSASEIAYAGDDLIDIPVLDQVGFSAAPADAAAVVRERVHWVTTAGGGKGAVRELCDFILAAQGLQDQLLQDILEA